MKNILLIVDMQEDFVSCKQTKEVKKRIIGLLDKNIVDVVIATRFFLMKMMYDYKINLVIRTQRACPWE